MCACARVFGAGIANMPSTAVGWHVNRVLVGLFRQRPEGCRLETCLQTTPSVACYKCEQLMELIGCHPPVSAPSTRQQWMSTALYIEQLKLEEPSAAAGFS